MPRLWRFDFGLPAVKGPPQYSHPFPGNQVSAFFSNPEHPTICGRCIEAVKQFKA